MRKLGAILMIVGTVAALAVTIWAAMIFVDLFTAGVHLMELLTSTK
jgi:hypothetical protein